MTIPDDILIDARRRFLPQAGVIGVGWGPKLCNGQVVAQHSIVIFVDAKLPIESLPRDHVIPAVFPSRTPHPWTYLLRWLHHRRRRTTLKVEESPTAKILGVLGGMGPLATAKFLYDLASKTPAKRDQDHPRIVVISDPTIPDRTEYVLGRGDDPRPKLFSAARQLRDAGAGLIAMPCNTASVFTSEIEAEAGIPLIHWINSGISDLDITRDSPVGILATTGTVRADLYQSELESLGFSFLTPDSEGQGRVMEAIYGDEGLKTLGYATEAARSLLSSVASQLRKSGANSLILGCTELPLILPSDSDSWPVPIHDPADSVIRRVLDWLIS